MAGSIHGEIRRREARVAFESAAHVYDIRFGPAVYYQACLWAMSLLWEAPMILLGICRYSLVGVGTLPLTELNRGHAAVSSYGTQVRAGATGF